MAKHRPLRWLLTAGVFVALCACSGRSSSTIVATDTPASINQSARAGVTRSPTPTVRAATPTAKPARPTATATVDPDLLLPDLQTLPPTDLRIQVNSATGQKLLRFTNSILNSGPGVLEVVGILHTAIGKTVVDQHIYKRDGSYEERIVGEFIFHIGHNHWHLENFALYEVWSLTADGELDSVVALTDKVSYCLRDNSRSDLPGAAPQVVYRRCNQQLQGMSAGWIDTYEFDTPGQIVDITHVADGAYALRSTVDPANHLREANDTNNAATVYFELQGNRVIALDPSAVIDRTGTSDN